MSRAVRPPACESEAGAAELSGACWTIVVVRCSPTAPVARKTPAVTPPPITAAASGITTERAGMTGSSVADARERGLNRRHLHAVAPVGLRRVQRPVGDPAAAPAPR